MGLSPVASPAPAAFSQLYQYPAMLNPRNTPSPLPSGMIGAIKANWNDANLRITIPIPMPIFSAPSPLPPLFSFPENFNALSSPMSLIMPSSPVTPLSSLDSDLSGDTAVNVSVTSPLDTNQKQMAQVSSLSVPTHEIPNQAAAVSNVAKKVIPKKRKLAKETLEKSFFAQIFVRDTPIYHNGNEATIENYDQVTGLFKICYPDNSKATVTKSCIVFRAAENKIYLVKDRQSDGAKERFYAGLIKSIEISRGSRASLVKFKLEYVDFRGTKNAKVTITTKQIDSILPMELTAAQKINPSTQKNCQGWVNTHQHEFDIQKMKCEWIWDKLNPNISGEGRSFEN